MFVGVTGVSLCDCVQDYFLVTVEPQDVLRLQWSVGGVAGSFEVPGFLEGLSEVMVTR